MNKTYLNGQKNQRGAALLTTMVFLVVLTVVGVSTMQNNRQDQRMAYNIQELNHAFQFGESGLVPGLKSPEVLSTDANTVDFNPPDFWLCHQSGNQSIAVDCDAGSNNGNAAIETAYRGKGNLPPVNFSLESGFISHYFYVASRGRSNKVQSIHETGISVVGPDDLGN